MPGSIGWRVSSFFPTSDPPPDASDGALLWLTLPVYMVPVDEAALE